MIWPASSLCPVLSITPTRLANSIRSVKEACPEADVSVQTELLMETSDLLSEMRVALAALTDATDRCAAIGEGEEQALAYHSQVVPAMTALRAPWTVWR